MILRNNDIFVFQNELSDDVLTSGLVHEIDAKVTARGRQKRVAFPHMLLMNYLAAWYLCKQNILENLYQAFPTWKIVKKHEELVRVCCGLMKGKEEVITHLVEVCKEAIKEGNWIYGDSYPTLTDDEHMMSFQNECGIEKPYFVVYPPCCEVPAFRRLPGVYDPAHGRSLSEVLNTAKIVEITDLSLTGENGELTLPCNADIVIYLNRDINYSAHAEHLESDFISTLSALKMHVALRTSRDHIMAITVGPGYICQNVSSLLPSSSLVNLCCSLQEDVVKSLAKMPHLTHLALCRNATQVSSLSSHADLFANAVKAWKGKSKLKELDLDNNDLPMSVCRPLLAAIAANCPCLEVLDMGHNTLHGCLAGFMQNPPPALRAMDLQSTDLQAEDMQSLAAAATAGKLQHLEILNLGNNSMSGCLTGFLQNPPAQLKQFSLSGTRPSPEDIESLTAAVKAGKLQHLEALNLGNYNLDKCETEVLPLVHALQTTLGDRKLFLNLCGCYTITMPIDKQLAAEYLEATPQELKDYMAELFDMANESDRIQTDLQNLQQTFPSLKQHFQSFEQRCQSFDQYNQRLLERCKGLLKTVRYITRCHQVSTSPSGGWHLYK